MVFYGCVLVLWNRDEVVLGKEHIMPDGIVMSDERAIGHRIKLESIARAYRKPSPCDPVVEAVHCYCSDRYGGPKNTQQVELFIAANITHDLIAASDLLPSREVTVLILKRLGYETDGCYWYRKSNKMRSVYRYLRSFLPHRKEKLDVGEWGSLDVPRKWNAAVEED
jgi:hypothetical protein